MKINRFIVDFGEFSQTSNFKDVQEGITFIQRKNKIFKLLMKDLK